MKIATIAPVSNLGLCSSLSNTYMILAWLCKTPTYLKFYKKIREEDPKAFFILDNGLNEDNVSSAEEIMKYAKILKVNEIVIPDMFDDTETTQILADKFIQFYGEDCKKNNFQLMGVIQGLTKNNFLKCYNKFLSAPNINTLGIGYRNLLSPFFEEMNKVKSKEWKEMGIADFDYLTKKLEENTLYYTLSRIYFIKKYVNFDDLKKLNKKIHLLGLWNPYELSLYSKVFTPAEMKYIRSCDSAILSQAAQANVIFDPRFGVVNKPKKILGFMDKMNNEEMMNFYCNLKILKQWLKKSKIGAI